ncbi:hypothetical protein [Streptomyces melanogenes]|uniref:hypothetical protein n=1 Tax=Streptomyces melanogenes TaxID=67326 RepID=UPI00167CEC6D|nr:hypothetical protein [Streptomyces melanogenes]GGP46390.1 hypothetical protein GCM10010278_24040 [Streptomyces melanogenes]
MFDIDPVRNRFSARLWLWTICPDRSSDPLPHVSLTNADDPVTSEPHVVDRGGQVLDQVLVQSSFRQEWDVRDFPFDRHRIEVLVTAPDDTTRFRFAPDAADSSLNPEIRPPGWRVTGFRLTAVDQHYATNYGDRGLRHGSTYSRVRIQIDVARADPTAFWKLTTPLYLALLIAAATFLVSSADEELVTAERLEGMHSRLGVLGGGLFVVVLNGQQVDSTVSSTSGLTLMDWLHLATLAFLLLAVAGTVLAWRWTARGGSTARAERLSRRGAWIGLAAYAVTCGGLVALAACR